LAIFLNLARNISPNFRANELKLGKLLVPHLFSKRENFMALGRSVGEEMALKFAYFENVCMFGAT